MMSNGLGAKFDGGKLLFSLLTRSLAGPVRVVVAVLTYGANKYAAESWQLVPDARRRYEDALDRHLSQWRLGEDFDDESGLHHLGHAACNALFLLWFCMQEDKGRDYYTFNDPNKAALVPIPKENLAAAVERNPVWGSLATDQPYPPHKDHRPNGDYPRG